jgi:hypothetical protein
VLQISFLTKTRSKIAEQESLTKKSHKNNCSQSLKKKEPAKRISFKTIAVKDWRKERT